jgi:hypothetical protein
MKKPDPGVSECRALIKTGIILKRFFQKPNGRGPVRFDNTCRGSFISAWLKDLPEGHATCLFFSE